MKAVMYHYVRQFDEQHPNFRFLDVKNFRKQLDYFDANFGFVSFEEWFDFVKSGEMPKIDGKVLLTFDDAMKCHYDFVYPELVKRGLWGFFYVPTQPYTTGKLLDVHRIHLLCGAFNGAVLFEVLIGLVSKEMIPDEKREAFRNETYTKQNNDEGVSEFKRLLNYFVDYEYRESLIDSVASLVGYTFVAAEFYIAESSLTEMSNNGMVIGSHTVNHPVMGKLSKKEQRLQIVESLQFLDNLGVIDSRTYCHPYGGFHSFDRNTVALLNNEAIEFSFNVESREINAGDRMLSMQHLPRFDCNEFAFGKVS